MGGENGGQQLDLILDAFIYSSLDVGLLTQMGLVWLFSYAKDFCFLHFLYLIWLLLMTRDIFLNLIQFSKLVLME